LGVCHGACQFCVGCAATRYRVDTPRDPRGTTSRVRSEVVCASPHSADFSGRGEQKAQPSDRRQSLGRLGEQLAAEHLVRRGFQILERNFRTRWGELDIVAFDGRTLVFCEVKTRRMGVAVSPFEALHVRKQAQVRRIARRWLSQRGSPGYARLLRFDAIGVTLDAGGRLVSLEHLEGAF
jgi:putative endonuclease